jgi:hypothetical protein
MTSSLNEIFFPSSRRPRNSPFCRCSEHRRERTGRDSTNPARSGRQRSARRYRRRVLPSGRSPCGSATDRAVARFRWQAELFGRHRATARPVNSNQRAAAATGRRGWSPYGTSTMSTMRLMGTSEWIYTASTSAMGVAFALARERRYGSRDAYAKHPRLVSGAPNAALTRTGSGNGRPEPQRARAGFSARAGGGLRPNSRQPTLATTSSASRATIPSGYG